MGIVCDFTAVKAYAGQSIIVTVLDGGERSRLAGIAPALPGQSQGEQNRERQSLRSDVAAKGGLLRLLSFTRSHSQCAQMAPIMVNLNGFRAFPVGIEGGSVIDQIQALGFGLSLGGADGDPDTVFWDGDIFFHNVAGLFLAGTPNGRTG